MHASFPRKTHRTDERPRVANCDPHTNPTARINVSQVPFCKTTFEIKQNFSSCCNFAFVYIEFSFSSLVRLLRLCSAHLVRFRKTDEMVRLPVQKHLVLPQKLCNSNCGQPTRFATFKNKRTHYRLQGEAGCPVTNEHQRGEGREGGQLQIPGHTHLSGPHMDSEHHIAC